jgi:hypothetical protein
MDNLKACQEGLRRTTKEVSLTTLSPDTVSNSGCPEYEAAVQTKAVLVGYDITFTTNLKQACEPVFRVS